MRLNIYCCLLAALLGSNVTADLIYEIAKEKQTITLPCPHSVALKVTWSRESEGRKVDILTVDGDGDKKHISDPGRRYSSQADGSLIILKASVSDSGRYFCNNEAAVELTVIPSGALQLLLVLGVVVPLLIIIVTILFITWACRYKRRERSEQIVYAEIPDQLINEAKQAPSQTPMSIYFMIQQH